MSDELILNVSFDNQTVTDATENWTLSGTPNVTYEQISGGSGYSLVTGSLGTPPTLVAVDQEAIYNEYTIDFNLYIKPSYTDTGWFSFFNLYTGLHYGGDYKARVYNGLTINLEVGSSTNAMVTIDSPTNRWIHITIISEYDSDTGAYTAYLYVDSVLRTYKQGTRLNGSPFAIGEKLVLFNRGGSSFFLPNTPGLAIDNLTVIAGIHVPNQTPAISLPNLSRVFQNFCTWISSQLSAVAKSGSYNDLSDKPTISTVNDGTLTIQKNGTNVATFTANQSTNATANITVPVNTSDLVNDSGFITSSSLPTVNNGTLTIQKNGTDVTTFTANQSTNATANITVPTAVSELTNDSGYLTSSSNLDASKLTSGTVDIARLPQGALERLVKVANEAARYALTTADVQLGDTVQQLDTGIMYIVTDADHLDSAAGYTEYTAGTAASVPWSGVTGKPTFAAVATSGAYSDLTGTPAIPTVNNATLTIQQNGVNVQTFTANASTNATANITVPTKTSDLTNDSGFITSDNTKIPLAGSNQISGSLIPATTDTYDLGSSSYQWNNAYTRNILIDNDINIASSLINKTSTSGMLSIRSGLTTTDGASIDLYGKDYGGTSSLIGNIYMTAYGDSDYTNFRIYPNGVIRVYNNSTATTKNVAMQEDVIPRSGGAVITGLGLGRSVNDGQLRYHGGTGWDMGATLSLYGKNEASFGGRILLHPSDGMNSKNMWIYPDGTWTWDGTACQITSDQRFKQQIAEIDDKLLDAWEDVNLVQFKYNDAVETKSDKARLHTGYVVQQIDEACKKHNVDISAYGLYCHEEYPEETEEVEVEQADGTKTKERKVIREASEHYSLRYTEALIVECAYLRKCIKELRNEIEQLKSSK